MRLDLCHSRSRPSLAPRCPASCRQVGWAEEWGVCQWPAVVLLAAVQVAVVAVLALVVVALVAVVVAVEASRGRGCGCCCRRASIRAPCRACPTRHPSLGRLPVRRSFR